MFDVRSPSKQTQRMTLVSCKTYLVVLAISILSDVLGLLELRLQERDAFIVGQAAALKSLAVSATKHRRSLRHVTWTKLGREIVCAHAFNSLSSRKNEILKFGGGTVALPLHCKKNSCLR
jgi:hypothetical protein